MPKKLIAREVNNSRDKDLEKKKREIYFGCQHPGEVAGSNLNNWPLPQQDGHLELQERFNEVCAREQLS